MQTLTELTAIMPRAHLKQLESGEIVSVKKPIDFWPEDKPVPEGMIRTKKGTLITLEKHESLQRARQNAMGKTGRPVARHTVLAEKMKEALIEQAHKAIDEMTAAQIMNAKGITIMMARKWETNKKTGEEHRTGEFAQVKDIAEIEELLNGTGQGDDFYQITTKNPSVEAFKVLLEQSMGRPRQFDKDDQPQDSLAVIINNIQKDGSRSSTVTVVPKQIKSSQGE